MTVPLVKGGFEEGIAAVGEAIKNAALWAGRMIKEGFIWLGEAITNAWNNALPYIKDAAFKTLDFLRTPAGFVVVGTLLATALGVSAETVNDNKAVALSLRVAAAALLVGVGIAIGVGITHGFLTPIV